MKRFKLSLAMGLFSLLCQVSASHAFLEFNGTIGYNYSGNSVTMTADEIRNTSSNTTSGTVHLQLIATTQSSPFGPFFRLADFNLSLLPNQFAEGSGRIPPGRAFIHVTADTIFTPPPPGTYFMHMVLTQFDPDASNDGLDTFLDTATFQNQETFAPGPDDYGGTIGTATPIAPNSSTVGTINAPGDIDVFRIVLGSSGNLTVRTTGSTDTVGALLDAGGSVIDQNDDQPSDLNFAISRTLQAGTYYVRVQHFSSSGTGSYTLVASFDGATQLANDAAITGIFFDPATSGQGFNVTYGTPGLTIFFYGHTSDGERLWLVSETLAIDLAYGQPVALQMFEVPGGTFGQPDESSLLTWGTLTITIQTCDSIDAVLGGADGTQQMDLIRLSGVAGLDC